MLNEGIKKCGITVGGINLYNIPVKIFFYNSPKSAQYQMLITTYCSIDAVKAFNIYKFRWSIEKFNKKSKQHLKLGGSQNVDFDANIADTKNLIITYNILSSTKPLNKYQSNRRQFRKIVRNINSSHIMDRIYWMLEQSLDILIQILEIDIYGILEEKLSSPDFDNKYLKTNIKLAS